MLRGPRGFGLFPILFPDPRNQDWITSAHLHHLVIIIQFWSIPCLPDPTGHLIRLPNCCLIKYHVFLRPERILIKTCEQVRNLLMSRRRNPLVFYKTRRLRLLPFAAQLVDRAPIFFRRFFRVQLTQLSERIVPFFLPKRLKPLVNEACVFHHYPSIIRLRILVFQEFLIVPTKFNSLVPCPLLYPFARFAGYQIQIDSFFPPLLYQSHHTLWQGLLT